MSKSTKGPRHYGFLLIYSHSIFFCQFAIILLTNYPTWMQMGYFHFGFIAYFTMCLYYVDMELHSHFSFHLGELYYLLSG